MIKDLTKTATDPVNEMGKVEIKASLRATSQPVEARFCARGKRCFSKKSISLFTGLFLL